MGDKRQVKNRRYFDYLLLFIVLFLLGFGLVMIYSTSSYVSSLNYDGDGLYFLRKQAIAVVLGLAVMTVVSFIPTELYKKLAPLIYFVSLASIFLVLTGLGHESHGARRWIYIFGLSIQPAEIAKIGVIITSATLIDRMTPNSRRSWGGILVTLAPAALLSGVIYFLTDNFSSAFIVGGIAFMMITLSEKKNLRPYIILVGVAIIGVIAFIALVKFPDKLHLGFRGERVLAWLNPEAYADGKGFQPIQSLYGIGSGGIWGKGLGKSMQKLGFLPEAHNDMIFSIIIRDISSHITNTYENLLLCGVFTHIAMQVILNIAVVTNTIPNTGIALPFISYGGSSVIFLLAEMGIVMRVARDCDFKDAPPVKKKVSPILIVLFVFAVLSLAGYFTYKYLLETYRVVNVYVEGNVHYTDDEIKELIMTGDYGDNSLYLSHKYKNKEVTDIPFVETINVKILSKDSVKITVYEKALAGYVEYLGKYIYFDKDGIVVEASEERTDGIPEVVGIDFDYVVLHEKLPAKDEDLFLKVLNITKLMEKYEVDAEKIYFSGFDEVTLYKGDITIKLGKEKDLDIKIMNLNAILSKLEGMKGTLRMENYDESTKRTSFEKEEDSPDMPVDNQSEESGEESTAP